MSIEPTRDSQTLVAVLREQAKTRPNDRAYLFLSDSLEEVGSLTYSEVDQRARAIAAILQQRMTPGERAILVYPPGLDFICGFFGCLYAGVIAVPVYPPQLNQLTTTLDRFLRLAKNAEPKIILTDSPTLKLGKPMSVLKPELWGVKWVATDELDLRLSDEWQEPLIKTEDIAFLQYTSGSTGNPKGVMVSHSNLLHNSALIQSGFGNTHQTRIVSWLPLYHDMGLIGCVIQTVYLGGFAVLMSPFTFLKNPARWLQAITRYQGTTNAAPNFAYDYCVKKIKPEVLAQLDLSSWKVAANGAEPVQAETMERFSEKFSPCGFRKEAFYPCYGMAESTLAITCKEKDEGLKFKEVSTSALEQGKVEVVSDAAAASRARSRSSIRRLVSSGRPLSDSMIRIVNPLTLNLCTADEIGEIWVKNSSVAQGYWNLKSETESNFRATILNTGETGFLRTGDLGFVQDGSLYVTGRHKDLIIIRGKNFYPQDIEKCVASHPIVRNGSVAAFSIEVDQEEQLVIVAAINPLKGAELDAIVQSIRASVSRDFGLQIYGIACIKQGSLSKTSSGKIQRRNIRAQYLNGKLSVIHSWELNPARTVPLAS